MKLLILGAGEYGQLVKELAQNKYTNIDFLDDKSKDAIGRLDEYKILKDKYQNAVVAIGDNEIRAQWVKRLSEEGYNLPIIVSNSAYVSQLAIIEPGCIIEPMAVINSNAKIEKGTIISAGAVVNHNAIVKQYCHIDCNAVIGADVVISEKMYLDYGQVITINSNIREFEVNK